MGPPARRVGGLFVCSFDRRDGSSHGGGGRLKVDLAAPSIGSTGCGHLILHVTVGVMPISSEQWADMHEDPNRALQLVESLRESGDRTAAVLTSVEIISKLEQEKTNLSTTSWMGDLIGQLVIQLLLGDYKWGEIIGPLGLAAPYTLAECGVRAVGRALDDDADSMRFVTLLHYLNLRLLQLQLLGNIGRWQDVTSPCR